MASITDPKKVLPIVSFHFDNRIRPSKILCVPLNLNYYCLGNIGGQEYIIPFNHDSSASSRFFSPPKKIL
jgi:hypothetical protein